MQKKIIVQFSKGNSDSFQMLFEALYQGMCYFAKKYILDYDASEDVTQEAFIELWKQHKKFKSYHQIKAFLYTTIKNKCLNIIKHGEVKGKYARETIATETGVEDLVIENEVIICLKNAIEELPEQQKQTILLGMQGLKNDEIARNMDISVNTVKLYKKKAYQKLRSKINSSLLLLLLF